MNRLRDDDGRMRWFGRAGRLSVCFAVLVMGAGLFYSGCGREEQPFKCGVALETDNDVIRYCGGEREICVCATNYCAEEDNRCDSGYLYLADPFGPQKCEEGKPCFDDRPCVEKADKEGKIIETGSRAACFANGGESSSSSSSGGGGVGGMGMDGGVNGGMGGGT